LSTIIAVIINNIEAFAQLLSQPGLFDTLFLKYFFDSIHESIL